MMALGGCARLWGGFVVGLLVLLGVVVVAAGTGDEEGQPAGERMVLFIFTEHCFDVFLTNGLLAGSLDIFDLPCIKLTISKALGYGILVFSGLLKAPQIYNILKNKDATGISASAFYFDVAGYTVSPVYGFRKGFPISTYGETFIILVENLVLVALLWTYSRGASAASPSFKLMATGFYACFAAAVLHVPDGMLYWLPMVGSSMVIYSRLPQIYMNFSNGHTGQLALGTWILNVIGVIARVFTTATELDDPYQLASHSVAMCLNLTVVVQILIYRQATLDALAEGSDTTSKAEGGRRSARLRAKAD
jgi:mannose-P-dolichol utilization defect protein 1